MHLLLLTGAWCDFSLAVGNGTFTWGFRCLLQHHLCARLQCDQSILCPEPGLCPWDAVDPLKATTPSSFLTAE